MTIKLYNTLTRQVDEFKPIEPGIVRMYNCGPTVYDFAHIGNFRTFLFADLLRRMFEYHGYDVIQVMNLTDVGHMTVDDVADGAGEDKMQVAARRLKEAKKQGKAEVDNPDDPYQVAEYFIDAFVADAKLLGMKIADEYPQRMPRATANVPGMIAIIKKLIEREHAYVGADGVVYFDIQSFGDYGTLSGNTVEHLQSGAGGRVGDDQLASKKHPADFVLWKPDSKHIMKWDSPWGAGYPGWHIECSAMAMGLLERETIDIHTGGEDNIFPHHECEIAQSRGATGQPFAHYWMHARHLMIEGEKMSKSKGNFFTLRDLLAKGADPAAVRYELLKAPYRQNANLTMKGLNDSTKAVERLRRFAAMQPVDDNDLAGDRLPVEQAFGEALADDLNISAALGELFKWMNGIESPTRDEAAALRRMDGVLDVLEPKQVGQGAKPQAADGLTDQQIDERCATIHAARQAKDYDTSDRIRDELAEAGIEVQITRDGVSWKRKLAV